MNTELTLPGTIPGLLRQCSPVVLEELGELIGSGIVLEKPPVHSVEVYSHKDVRRRVMFPDQVALDLTDATGRAHAAWWLAKQSGLPPGGAIFGFKCRPDCTAFWLTSGSDGIKMWVTSDEPWLRKHLLPALVSLNPKEPGLLEDGSRWVDAEALRLVCLHVAGIDP